MQEAAIALAVLGFAVGMLFRLKVLLWIVAVLFIASVAVAVAQGFSLMGTAMTIMAAQFILQASYFLGLVARAVLTAAQRTRPVL